jgi:hypothetical protein
VLYKGSSSLLKFLGLTCALLLVCGAAGAQKKKTSDPYASMPPLPPPRLLNAASTPQTPGPTNSVAAAASAQATTPSASTAEGAPTSIADSVTASRAETGPASNPPSETASGADPALMVNPAAAYLSAAASTAAPPATTATPAAPAAASTVAPYSTMAPSTGLTHSSVLSINDYEHLLDIVMPADHRTRPGLQYTLILRFEPHIHPESQIVIRRWRDGTIETALFRVDKTNAWEAAYGKVAPGQTPDFDAIAKDVTVVRKSFHLAPSDEAQWRKQLMPDIQKELAKANKKIRHIEKERVHDLEINGTRYELWYIQGDNEMHFVSLDSEVDTMTKGNLVLTKLMNEVRSYADTHVADYKPLMFSPDEAKGPRTLLSSK